mgnify:CR=1 FL=1
MSRAYLANVITGIAKCEPVTRERGAAKLLIFKSLQLLVKMFQKFVLDELVVKRSDEKGNFADMAAVRRRRIKTTPKKDRCLI